MSKLTVTIRQLIVAKEEIMNYSISQQILHYGDTREFEKKYGLHIEAAKDKLNKLWKEYYMYENGKPVTEDVFEVKPIVKKHWLFKYKYSIKGSVKVGEKMLPSGKMTEEEFIKRENEILDKEITK